MPQKRYRPEEIIATLREVEVLINQGKKMPEVIKAIGANEVSHLLPLAQGVRGLERLASQASEGAQA